MSTCLRAFIATAFLAAATSSLQAQQTPPVMELSAPVATSTDHFGTIHNVRPLDIRAQMFTNGSTS